MPKNDERSRKCPKCASEAIRMSRRNAGDYILSLGGYRAYRCRECRSRFHLFSGFSFRGVREGRSESRKRRSMRRRRELIAYAAAAFAFAVVVFIITREGG